MSNDTPVSQRHRWKFFRTGGLDQVALETGADLMDLENLDQKLWVALSCPVKGLELDEKTLALIDSDKDGRIRVPELITAVKWAAARLKDPSDLLKGSDALPIEAINDQTPEGKVIASSARQILKNLGVAGGTALTAAQSSDTAKVFAASPINGDGVIPPEAAEDDETKALINDIITCKGGVKDLTGSAGVTQEQVDGFFGELATYLAWAEQGAAAGVAILGEGTTAAFATLQAVRAKVDDYFARCRLAAFDARALNALNRSEADYLAVAAKDMKITADEVSGFPLAAIGAAKPLPLAEGLNPAWAGAVAAFRTSVVVPLLGAAKTSLTEAEWLDLCSRFVALEKWLAQKSGLACDKLNPARAKALASGGAREKLQALLVRDKALQPECQAVNDVDRLVRYHRDLRALLHNFVNFADFYSRDKWAVFQAGTLYLDSRSTELCVRVDAPNPLAAMSKAYIAYCACTRPGLPALTIAACFTQGDSDYLFVGRHGVFYDRQGRDWDAVITSIVDAPISIRQAFWSPYKKFIRMIEEQIAKRAAAAETASSSKLATAAEKTANADKAKPVEPPKKIDVGAVAALGVAFGALTTALGYFLGFFEKLPAWQIPLVFVAVMLVISLPSMVIAWLKLRQRTLGPILDANGWAINGRVKINIPFGTALTEVAKLPAGAKRSLDDPYEDKDAKRRKRQGVVLLVLILIACGVAWTLVNKQKTGRYFWEPEPKLEKKEVPPADTAAQAAAQTVAPAAPAAK